MTLREERLDEYDVDAIDTGPTHQLVLADDLLEFIAAARRERELRELVEALSRTALDMGRYYEVGWDAFENLAAWLAEHGGEG